MRSRRVEMSILHVSSSGVSSSFPTAAVITAAGAVLVWALTRIAEYVQQRFSRSSDAQKYIIALFAEVDFNTRDMEIFLAESASVDAVVKKVREEQEFIPHITDARHTYIYSEGLANIHYIGKELIGKLVYFYGLLEKLRNQVAGIYLPSFGKISSDGRAATIEEIVATAAEISLAGHAILDDLRVKYPDFVLARTERYKPLKGLSHDELRRRHNALSLDLDRINASHKSSPRSH